MINRKCLLELVFIFMLVVLRNGQPIYAAEKESGHVPPSVASAELETNRKILVELFLAAERKSDLDQIKRELEAVKITRIRPQFFKLGNPPQNIAIGKNIPASVARLAIKLARTYNRDIKTILPEYRFFPDHIVIGSSAFDEKSEIPITPQDLEKLSDPSLDTEAFHNLYRRLTGEDTRLPKYTD
ncbi:MAG: hypothetical protein HY282_00115 [Nitrospirae bacterium]|nr:hypothetical protein [Candidatus Manganitrophaceae bacterium]